MPIVLTVSGSTASGLEYADVLGEKYFFPKRYKNYIVPGETAIFYTGSREYPGKEPLTYLGIAIVAEVTPAIEGGGDLQCGFHVFREFDTPVPFKKDGNYLEAKANTNPNHWRQGVRRIRPEELHQILDLEEQIRVS